MLSLAVGLAVGLTACFLGDLHVYKVRSGFSGESFWIHAPEPMQEESLLWQVINKEPALRSLVDSNHGLGYLSERRDHVAFDPFTGKTGEPIAPSVLNYATNESGRAVALFPYRAEEIKPGQTGEPETAQAIWLTEPATRIKPPHTLVGLVYAVGGFVCSASLAAGLLLLVRWGWCFLLARVAEFSNAIRGR